MMESADLVKLVGTGGFACALLALIYVVGMRLVAALDRVATKVDDHTAKDLAAHAVVHGEIRELHGKIDGLLDASDRFTPVGVEPPVKERRTPPPGYYSKKREQ